MAGQENLHSEALRVATALHAPDKLKSGGSPSPATVPADPRERMQRLAALSTGKAVPSG